ncbi:hypothetical protein SAMD00019534_085820 [Acytostelium subglobosum LB1]|uniref:hypothetical protein n=1 Tax=Acytostelium subglobosum LB1 TaxID=1410327 RepID=UPI0006447ACE|nr:hypothetical protein SAMD00019534_085820 [Acytostelium subglobosum LB1]GAM25407.1 hypothetical protein SAMD00019534_085820 [Acytostelium subglobosum LB1]|eukprot:XP_012751927.1 hypothetical protein SAMD00019534_085820 [Acytostelium subglobosum LB1]
MSLFKEYYWDENSEFRERHKAYIKQKVRCDCGFEVGRTNLNRHKQGYIHKQLMANK